MRQSIFFFLFLSLSCSKDGGKGNDDGRSTRPVRRTTARYKKNFVDGVFFFFSVQRSSHWSCRSSQSCASRSRRRNVSSAISQTTTKKKFFFSPLFTGTSLQLPKQRPKQCPFQKEEKKKLLFPAHVSLSQSGFRSAVFSPLFFYLSLIKLFLNFCSRYFLRNGMCGQAKLPGPEVKLRKIYSRHPLDFS